MWILKTKGTAKIPDYLQIRDDDFTLISHIKLFRNNDIKKRISLFNQIPHIDLIISQLEYGHIRKIG